MSIPEAYTFIGLAFLLGAIVGSGLTYGWAAREIMALRSDLTDLMDALTEANNKD